MGLLLDTHTIVWYVDGSESINSSVRSAIADKDPGVFMSLASFWEIAIKVSIGKLRLPVPLDKIHDDFVMSGVQVLPFEIKHILGVSLLPFHHRDPFDRLLAAQALAEDLTLVSRDKIFDLYGVKRIW